MFIASHGQWDPVVPGSWFQRRRWPRWRQIQMYSERIKKTGHILLHLYSNKKDLMGHQDVFGLCLCVCVEHLNR